MPDDMNESPAHLSHAGAVVDKAIEYMMQQKLSSLAIASALLGGSMALLAARCRMRRSSASCKTRSAASRSGELHDHQDHNGG